MADRNEVDLSELEDYRALSLDQRNAFKVRARHRAHVEREECLKAALRALGLRLRKLQALPGRAWHGHRARRCRQAEIGELYRLDERALRDIGVTSLDVHALARSRPGWLNK